MGARASSPLVSFHRLLPPTPPRNHLSCRRCRCIRTLSCARARPPPLLSSLHHHPLAPFPNAADNRPRPPTGALDLRAPPRAAPHTITPINNPHAYSDEGSAAATPWNLLSLSAFIRERRRAPGLELTACAAIGAAGRGLLDAADYSSRSFDRAGMRPLFHVGRRPVEAEGVWPPSSRRATSWPALH